MSQPHPLPAEPQVDPTLQSMEKTVTLAGREVTITPLKVRYIPRFAQVVGPIYQAIAYPPAKGKKPPEPDWLDLIAQHGEEGIELVSLGLGWEKDHVKELNLAELVTAISAVMEVNTDFFIRQLVPVITQASREFKNLRGQMSSSA